MLWEIERILQAKVGSPLVIDRLTSRGGPGSFKVSGPQGTGVFKRGVAERERMFYKFWARRLSGDLRVPKLLDSGTDPAPWIFLEFLPWVLPRDQWRYNPAIVRYLSQFHETSPQIFNVASDGYRFIWDDALTADAIMGFGIREKQTMSAILAIMQGYSHYHLLFHPITVIHGDPNPTNWVLDTAQHIALIDWSRYGWAHPAIDLAIAIPGLPNRQEVEWMANTYARLGPQKRAGQSLADLILAAKLWSCVEFLAMNTRGELSEGADEGVQYLKTELPAWIHQTFEAI